jgi:PX domain
VVYYSVKISLLGKKWELKKRYREFDALHSALLEAHGSVPSLPAKTMGMITSTNDIILRKEELNQYLKKCVDFFDLFNDEAFVAFLEVNMIHRD